MSPSEAEVSFRMATLWPWKTVCGYVPGWSLRRPKREIDQHARLPIDADTKLMIPVAVGLVFKAGNNAAAVKAGAKSWFGKDVATVGWIETERYMGLFHEVVPKQDALQCNACHAGGDRLDWKALGYKGDPEKTGGRHIDLVTHGTAEATQLLLQRAPRIALDDPPRTGVTGDTG